MSSPSRRPFVALMTVAVLAAAPAAHAVLDGDLASVQADGLRLRATRVQRAGLAMQVHELRLPDGGTVRQYADASGRVFAVAWHTRGKPRLDALLGTHFAAYAEAGRRAQAQRAGVRHAAQAEAGDLVVQSQAHLQAHVGRAWLKSRLPAGVNADALR